MKTLMIVAVLVGLLLAGGCACCGQDRSSGSCGHSCLNWWACGRMRCEVWAIPADPAGMEVPPPPVPLAESIPTVPDDDYVWIPGYWDWTGSDYQWVRGQWMLPPGTARVWVPPRYDLRAGRYFYYRGYWASVERKDV
ncbi:MAG: YXWGXW repeat-containing protein [Planctomycetaceae bacterium]|nr:YXWGXW repeat-containing protein [Planctomycetaceae bacterium]